MQFPQNLSFLFESKKFKNLQIWKMVINLNDFEYIRSWNIQDEKCSQAFKVFDLGLYHNKAKILFTSKKMFPLQQKLIKFNKEQYNLLFGQNDLKQAAKTMGQSINKFYQSISENQAVTVISVLERSAMFFTDLLKTFSFKMVPEFIFERDVYRQNCEQVNFDLLHFEVLKGQHVLLVSNSFDEKQILPLIVDKINKVGPKSLQTAIFMCQNGSIGKMKTVNTYTAFTHSTKELIGYGFGRQQKLGALPQIYQKANHSKTDIQK